MCKNKIMKGLNKLSDNRAMNKTSDVVAKAAPVAMAVAMILSTTVGFAADGDVGALAEIMTNALNLIYGFCYFAGIVSLVVGIVNIAGAVSEEGGQDAQKMQKGKGGIVRGIILVAAPTVLLILGVDSAKIVNVLGGNS